MIKYSYLSRGWPEFDLKQRLQNLIWYKFNININVV